MHTIDKLVHVGKLQPRSHRLTDALRICSSSNCFETCRHYFLPALAFRADEMLEQCKAIRAAFKVVATSEKEELLIRAACTTIPYGSILLVGVMPARSPDRQSVSSFDRPSVLSFVRPPDRSSDRLSVRPPDTSDRPSVRPSEHAGLA